MPEKNIREELAELAGAVRELRDGEVAAELRRLRAEVAALRAAQPSRCCGCLPHGHCNAGHCGCFPYYPYGITWTSPVPTWTSPVPTWTSTVSVTAASTPSDATWTAGVAPQVLS